MATPRAHEILDDRRYTKDHEWARRDGERVVVGITAFAVDQLGDITLVSLDAKPGTELADHQAFGTIESVKTLSDLFAPLAGKVLEVNEALVEAPELVNEDCWGKAWMVALEPVEPGAFEGLMDAAAYRRYLEESAH